MWRGLGEKKDCAFINEEEGQGFLREIEGFISFVKNMIMVGCLEDYFLESLQ